MARFTGTITPGVDSRKEAGRGVEEDIKTGIGPSVRIHLD